MTTLYTHQDSNIRKTWALMVLFLGIVVALGWFLSYYYQSPGILYIAVIFSIVMNVGSYWFSDKIVLSMYRARPFERKESEQLWDIVENLSITAGLPMPKIFIIDDPAPNAFATGRDKEHAVVALTTGIIGMLEKNELEGVIAHELAHIGNRDMLISTMVVVLVGFVTILSDIFIRSGHWGRGGGGKGDNRIQGIILIAGVILAILSPIIAKLIQLAISRKREFLADASGALLTRYPEGLANALRKISRFQGPMSRANNATAHLFISSPFGAEALKGLHRLFATHPPVEDRISALLGKSARGGN